MPLPLPGRISWALVPNYPAATYLNVRLFTRQPIRPWQASGATISPPADKLTALSSRTSRRGAIEPSDDNDLVHRVGCSVGPQAPPVRRPARCAFVGLPSPLRESVKGDSTLPMIFTSKFVTFLSRLVTLSSRPWQFDPMNYAWRVLRRRVRLPAVGSQGFVPSTQKFLSFSTICTF
jgi:hypothetical protein